MPSLATVISLTYCSGVAWPGITALFSPSMPIEMAPLRLTLALSINSTRSLGLRSLAFTAAIRPPVPPPMTTRSNSRSIWFMNAPCSTTIDAQPVLEGIAAVIEELEVDRLLARVGEPLDAQQRRGLGDAQLARERLVGGDRFDLHVGMRELLAEVVLEDHEDVARGQVFLRQALAEREREVADVHRNRLAVEVAQALDLEHRCADRKCEPIRHHLAGLHPLGAQHLREGLVARRRHRFAEALQPRQVLEGLGLGDEA